MRRFVVIEGNYIGTSDNVAGRWYVVDWQSGMMDMRGRGKTYRQARREAKLLNEGHEPGEAAFIAEKLK